MKTNRTNAYTLTLMALGALTTMACDVDSGPEVVEAADAVADEALVADADDEGAILDELVLAEGVRVRFVDERVSIADGGIGMLALGIPRFAEAVHSLELTPLELYLALAPENDAPARLWEDHARLAASPTPRAFRLEQGALVPAAVEAFAARAPEPLFAQTVDGLHVTVTCYAWSQAFCPDIDANQGGYDACASSYASASLAYAHTGVAGQRWLGGTTCNEDWDWQVQVESLANVWGVVSGTSISMTPNEWVVYTSTSITASDYRSKVVLTSPTPWQYYLTAARD